MGGARPGGPRRGTLAGGRRWEKSPVLNDQKPDQFDHFQKNLVVSEIQKSGNTGDLTLVKNFPKNFFAINKFGFFPCKPHYFKDYLACSSLCFYVVIIKVALQLMIILTLIVHQFVFWIFEDREEICHYKIKVVFFCFSLTHIHGFSFHRWLAGSNAGIFSFELQLKVTENKQK